MSKGIVLGVATKTPTYQEIQNFPHIIVSSEHELDTKNVHFPKAPCTVEEDISRTVGSVMNQVEAFLFCGKI